METKKQFIQRTGFQIGDKVKFHTSIIKKLKKDYIKPTAFQLEVFGMDILKSCYESHCKEYKVVGFENHNGSWVIIINKPGYKSENSCTYAGCIVKA